MIERYYDVMNLQEWTPHFYVSHEIFNEGAFILYFDRKTD
jgi:hypothetical protein